MTTRERTPSVNPLYAHHKGEHNQLFAGEPTSPTNDTSCCRRRRLQSCEVLRPPCFAAVRSPGSPPTRSCFEQCSVERAEKKNFRTPSTTMIAVEVTNFTSQLQLFETGIKNSSSVRNLPLTNVSRMQYSSLDQGDIYISGSCVCSCCIARPIATFFRFRSVNGFEYETYELCARQLGLVHGVDEYALSLHARGYGVRRSAGTPSSFCNSNTAQAPPAPPLWEEFSGAALACVPQTNLVFQISPHDNTEFDRLVNNSNKTETA